MTVELEKVSMWLKSKKLSVNVNKTKWLLFHPISKIQLLPEILHNLFIENIRIKRQHITKFLGVFIDGHLSWKQYINIVSSKISKSIGILYKSRNILTKQCPKQLCFYFIHNYVKYPNIMCASTSKSKHERLCCCQKHATNVSYHKDW